MRKHPALFIYRFIAMLLVSGLGMAIASAKSTGKQSDGEKASRTGKTNSEQIAPIMMKAFKISETPPKLNFGMSLSIWTNNITNSITAVYVTNVKPDSDAEKAGIGLFTRIVSIEGKPVEEMEPSFIDGTDLNKAFVNRQPGDRLTLTVIPQGGLAPIKIHLVNRIRKYTRIDFLLGR